MLAFGLPVIDGMMVASKVSVVIVTFSRNYLIGIFMLIASARF